MPFNNPRFKPVYTGTISPEDSNKSREAMTMMLEKSKSSNPLTNNLPISKFYLKEKRQNTEAKYNIVKGHSKKLLAVLRQSIYEWTS